MMSALPPEAEIGASSQRARLMIGHSPHLYFAATSVSRAHIWISIV